jgi:PII-like signaling protein
VTAAAGPGTGGGPVLDGGAGGDAVTLTSYFGERSRTGGRFAADALLDWYGREQVAASVLLRGAEGFGARRHPRTDASLSLSEDLPLIAVAVGTRARIEPLAEETARLCGTGLVTLESAVTADTKPGEVKLTVYLGRAERAGRLPAYVAVCDLLWRRGIAGAAVLLGVDGTLHGQRERAAFFSRNAATPLMVVAVGDGARIAAVLTELTGLLARPVLTLERVRICKRDGELLGPPPPPQPAAVAAPVSAVLRASPPPPPAPRWQKLMVFTSESTLHDGQPVQRAIVRRLRAAGLSGATTLRGVWGFHGDHAPHGDRLLQAGRRVPAVTEVIDAPERIAEAFAVIDELTSETGLVTCETVPTVHAWADQVPAGNA